MLNPLLEKHAQNCDDNEARAWKQFQLAQTLGLANWEEYKTWDGAYRAQSTAWKMRRALAIYKLREWS